MASPKAFAVEARRVMLLVPDVAVVPVISPVEEFMVRPAGNPEADQVTEVMDEVA